MTSQLTDLVEVGWFVFDLRPDGRVSEELEVEVVLVVPGVCRPVLSLAQPQLLVVPSLLPGELLVSQGLLVGGAVVDLVAGLLLQLLPG